MKFKGRCCLNCHQNTLKPHTIKHQYMTMGFENIKIKNMMF